MSDIGDKGMLIARHAGSILTVPLLLTALLIAFPSTSPITSSDVGSSDFSIHASQLSLNAPPSYSWSNLRTDTISVTFSVKEKIWSSGTGELDVRTHNNGTFSDAKSTTATITIPEGVSAGVYVCGEDRYSRIVKPCEKWYSSKKLEVYVDGNLNYSLGNEYWWMGCYSKVATIGPGMHTVELVISATVWSYCNSGDGEYYVGQGFLEICLEGSGSVQASSHEATAILDGAVTHTFTFRLPQITFARNVSWKAVWKDVSKVGSGPPGSIQRVSFDGANRDCWSFTSPVILRVNDPVPSVNAEEGYRIDAVYHEGASSVGLYGLAVALSDGDEVGYTSGSYLVTDIRRDIKVTGGTSIGSAVWANSGSAICFNQTISYYCSSGWVTEGIRGGVETGFDAVKVFEELNVSRRVRFSSKNRNDEVELTAKIPKLTLVFTRIVVMAERNGDNVNARAFWAHDNSPIAGLRMKCFETDQSGVTDLNGRVSFPIAGSGSDVTIYPTEGKNGITAFEKARARL